MALNILTAISAFKRDIRRGKFSDVFERYDAAMELLELIHEEARAQKFLLRRAEIALGNLLPHAAIEIEGMEDRRVEAPFIEKCEMQLKTADATFHAIRDNRIARAQHIRHNTTGDRRYAERAKP